MFSSIGNELDSKGKYRKADRIDSLFIRLAQIDLNKLRYLRDFNPHALFESTPQDDIKKIERNYRLKAKEYHPDINRDPAAEEAFKILQEAIDKIRNKHLQPSKPSSSSENINIGRHLNTFQILDYIEYPLQQLSTILFHIHSCPWCQRKIETVKKIVEEHKRYDNFKHFTNEELDEIKEYPEKFFREIKIPQIKEMLIKHLKKCYLCQLRLGSGNFINRLLELLTGEKP
jgi:hypothetical protein